MSVRVVLLAAAAGLIMSIASWVVLGLFDPHPRFVRVDVGSLYEAERSLLASKIKPGMSEDEQKALFASAGVFGQKVDTALGRLAVECRCAVLNSAAILRVPDDGRTGITDATARVRALLREE